MTFKLENTTLLRASLPLRFKFAGPEADAGSLEGYGSTFGGAPDSYGDIVAHGAFRRTLREHAKAGTMPVMLWAHDQHRPIGRWIEMREDGRGLFVRGQLNLKTDAGREAHAHLSEGDVGGLSIGFREAPSGRRYNQDGTSTLTDLDLGEVSVVAMPANPSARVTQVKNLQSRIELEQLLRDAGLARGAAVKLAAGGWPALSNEPETPTPDLEPLLARIKAATLDLKKG